MLPPVPLAASLFILPICPGQNIPMRTSLQTVIHSSILIIVVFGPWHKASATDIVTFLPLFEA